MVGNVGLGGGCECPKAVVSPSWLHPHLVDGWSANHPSRPGLSISGVPDSDPAPCLRFSVQDLFLCFPAFLSKGFRIYENKRWLPRFSYYSSILVSSRLQFIYLRVGGVGWCFFFWLFVFAFSFFINVLSFPCYVALVADCSGGGGVVSRYQW